jgi:deazaflavin-dependent oxidoreductase (nitroreductase family)
VSATAQRATAPPPRVLIRSFWMLHRAIVRISRGRIGLTRPQPGRRFGMMGLTTIGRRSGQRRMAMIGYYEDGENLVTLAMNGWADTDPAWWLNLQAYPETTVTTSAGHREMRARAAAGEERERLWARFRDYPGWGDDIDALAARRPGPTTVVVFEPRRAGADAVAAKAGDGGDAAFAPTVATVERDQPARFSGKRGQWRAWRFRARHLWLVPGLAIAVHANGISSQHGLGLIPLLAFGIMPHLTVLAGLGQPHGPGQLAARAVPMFNALHHPAPPLALAALGAAGVLSPFWLVGGLAWLSHLVVDWAIGDGLRDPSGFVRRPIPALVGGSRS